MELTLHKIEIPEVARKMFEAGETSKRVAERLRIRDHEAHAMKKVWCDETAPPPKPKAPKAEKPAKAPKAPKEPKE